MLNKVDDLIQKLEACRDPATRETARELVQTLLDFHADGLKRMAHAIAEHGGTDLPARLADDPVIGQMLLLHGLHPDDTRTRVMRAIEKQRPYLHSHGGNVEVLDVDEDRVRLQFQGSCRGCPSSTLTLKQRIEEAILEAAPDVAIEVV